MHEPPPSNPCLSRPNHFLRFLRHFRSPAMDSGAPHCHGATAPPSSPVQSHSCLLSFCHFPCCVGWKAWGRTLLLKRRLWCFSSRLWFFSFRLDKDTTGIALTSCWVQISSAREGWLGRQSAGVWCSGDLSVKSCWTMGNMTEIVFRLARQSKVVEVPTPPSPHPPPPSCTPPPPPSLFPLLTSASSSCLMGESWSIFRREVASAELSFPGRVAFWVGRVSFRLCTRPSICTASGPGSGERHQRAQAQGRETTTTT